MVKLVSALAILSATAVLSLPARSAERPRGVLNLDQFELSSRHRGNRGVTGLHYYDSYPWWWHPPYAHRARTYYLPWPSAAPDSSYHHPHMAGVVGVRMFGF